jgi:hypothetical protein
MLVEYRVGDEGRVPLELEHTGNKWTIAPRMSTVIAPTPLHTYFKKCTYATMPSLLLLMLYAALPFSPNA